MEHDILIKIYKYSAILMAKGTDMVLLIAQCSSLKEEIAVLLLSLKRFNKPLSVLSQA